MEADDTYTAAEAAKVIGVTVKRVRQMIAEGKLHPVPGIPGPLRVPMVEAHELRTRRRQGPAPSGPRSGTVSVEEITRLLEKALEGQRQLIEAETARAHAARDRAEELLRTAHAEERARRIELEAEIAELRAQLIERRRWWGR